MQTPALLRGSLKAIEPQGNRTISLSWIESPLRVDASERKGYRQGQR